MAQSRVVILGGHGKVALLAAPRLVAAGFEVEAVVRNPDHREDVLAAGANPVVLDIEQADISSLADLFSGASAVLFSAGAGGGDPARTRAVDRDAAIRSMVAAAGADVRRYIMVSYARAATDVDRLDPEHDRFYPYAKAKHDADAYLRGTNLDYTILGPGALTMAPASGRIRMADDDGRVNGEPLGAERAVTSRGNVAAAIAHVIATGAARRATRNFYDGDVPLAEAFAEHRAG